MSIFIIIIIIVKSIAILIVYLHGCIYLEFVSRIYIQFVLGIRSEVLIVDLLYPTKKDR